MGDIALDDLKWVTKRFIHSLFVHPHYLVGLSEYLFRCVLVAGHQYKRECIVGTLARYLLDSTWKIELHVNIIQDVLHTSIQFLDTDQLQISEELLIKQNNKAALLTLAVMKMQADLAFSCKFHGGGLACTSYTKFCHNDVVRQHAYPVKIITHAFIILIGLLETEFQHVTQRWIEIIHLNRDMLYAYITGDRPIICHGLYTERTHLSRTRGRLEKLYSILTSDFAYVGQLKTNLASMLYNFDKEDEHVLV